jgi:hypothetical protein
MIVSESESWIKIDSERECGDAYLGNGKRPLSCWWCTPGTSLWTRRLPSLLVDRSS